MKMKALALAGGALFAVWLAFPGPLENEVRRSRYGNKCDDSYRWESIAASKIADKTALIVGWYRKRLSDRPNDFKIVQGSPVLRAHEYSWRSALLWFWRLRSMDALLDMNDEVRHLVRFKKYLSDERDVYGPELPSENRRRYFIPSPAVQRVGSYSWEIRLSAGDFKYLYDADTLKLFQRTVMQIVSEDWSVPPFTLHVVWDEEDPRAYSFRLQSNGGSHFVNRSKREVHFLEKVSRNTISHEIGHVLGFSDHYAYVWSENHCKIARRNLSYEIMGVSNSGIVRYSHWALLDKSYPRGRGEVAQTDSFYKLKDL